MFIIASFEMTQFEFHGYDIIAKFETLEEAEEYIKKIEGTKLYEHGEKFYLGNHGHPWGGLTANEILEVKKDGKAYRVGTDSLYQDGWNNYLKFDKKKKRWTLEKEENS